MTNNAIHLLKQRYCRGGETPEHVYHRVTEALALGDSRFKKRLYKTMAEGIFLPNSPCIRNAGSKRAMPQACFKLPIEDSIESIFDAIKNSAIIFHHGGGVGYNFSKLRPNGAPLSSGGETSGNSTLPWRKHG